MTRQATFAIVIDLDRDITPEIAEGLSNLLEVMKVQAEDGVYTLGYKDAEDLDPFDEAGGEMHYFINQHVADVERIAGTVQIQRFETVIDGDTTTIHNRITEA